MGSPKQTGKTPQPVSRALRFALGVSVLLVAGLALVANARDDGDSAKKASNPAHPGVSEGYQQLKDGRLDAAMRSFKSALDDDPDDLPAMLGRAMIHADRAQHEAAFDSYDAVVREFPKHAFAWNGRGLAAFNLRDFDAALESFQKATSDNPEEGFFHESLAWTLMCRGEFRKAAEAAKTASLMYDRKGKPSLYPLLIAYFSHIEAGDEANARRALDYAEANRNENRWPAPAIDYLRGEIDEAELISHVTSTAEETEAHTYIGLHLRNQPDRAEAAQRHLDWVRRAGDPEVFEYTLARSIDLPDRVAVHAP